MKDIFVTKPSLPNLEDLIPLLHEIWDRGVLTNSGPFHKKLEDSLCDYLNVPHISLFCNGSIALVTALKALDITGEVITTPYSFVATAHSLVWNNIKPIFVDIDSQTLCLDPNKIEESITSKTSAILPVHVYGQPCDVDAIEEIAKKHKLKVIYDAAHAFGVKCHCGSILNHGDLSVLSFHATKVFNTFEGGAIICKDYETKQRIDQLKNFGFISETSVTNTGINGKMNEFSSAIGLLQIRTIDDNINKRKKIDNIYRNNLKKIPGIRLYETLSTIKTNHSYFPVFVEIDYSLTRDQLYFKMKENGINCRRYFYPLITDLEVFKNRPENFGNVKFTIATKAAETVLCLPIYPSLSDNDVHNIINIISKYS